MDVCFITRGGREGFLESRLGAHPGDVIDTSGAVVGRHRGVAAFTVGQRRGVGVAVGERRYVVDVDAATATVTIGTRRELERDAVRVRDVVVADHVAAPMRIQVQVRAHGDPIDATFDGDVVRFTSPQARVAPGQVVAFYDGELCLGGGIAQ
jgi:tRNA-specific 2-thiouridylase